MKSSIKTLYKLSLVLFLSTLIVACSDDDDTIALTGTGMVKIEFDNSIAGNDLILGVSNPPNTQNEALTVNRLNYIVSNFTLTDVEGNTFTYPKDESYFIISEETGNTEVTLTQIPAGNYTTLTFGVGVDQEKYQQGAEGQGTLITEAENTEMMWDWQAGYKFLNFEGSFTSGGNSSSTTDFKIHMGSLGSSLDNYRETTLAFPNDDRALVSATMTPIIHLVADANHILDGTHKIALTEQAVIMVSEEKLPQIAQNTAAMFRVDHVHNGEGGGH